MWKLYLAIAFILAGSSVVSASFVSEQLPVFTTTALSLMFAAATAVLLCGKKMYTTAKLLTGRIWWGIALQALFGCFLFRVFLTSGLQYIGVAEAGIITGVTPAITALFAWIMLREMLNVQIILGIATAVAGILLVQGYPCTVLSSSQKFCYYPCHKSQKNANEMKGFSSFHRHFFGDLCHSHFYFSNKCLGFPP